MTEHPKPFGNHRNPDYLKFIRNQPCLVTGSKSSLYESVAACHENIFGDKGTSIKCSDYTAVPLLQTLHRDHEHQHGNYTFWSQYPWIDVKKEIIRLNIEYIESKRKQK
jgi:hypothetical protein